MQKSRGLALATLAAVSGLALSASSAVGNAVAAAKESVSNAFENGNKKKRGKSRHSVPGRWYRRGNSRRYPEQSTRQAVRAARRAQGGPGLAFDNATRSWWPRHASETGERA